MINTNSKHTFLLLLLTFTVSLSVYAKANQSDSISQIQNQSITIASEPDYPPYCMVDKDGNAYGFSIDLFMAATKAMNIDVKIKTGIWNQIKQDLEHGKIDALPLVGKTPEREQIFDFSLPYITLHGAIFVKKGFKKIRNLEDIRNLRIAVMKGDNADEYVQRKKISDFITQTHTFEEAFIMLANKEVDIVLAQRVMGLELLKEMNLKSVVPVDLQLPDFRQDFCFAVKKGNNELLSQLNEGLSIIIANKTYDDLHLKWFGPSVQEDISFEEIVEIAIYILIPLIIIFSLVFIVSLRFQVKKRTILLRNEIEEHKKSQIELAESKLFLSTLIENSGTVIYVKSKSGHYQLANKKWEEVTKIPREKALGKTDMELFPEAIGKQFRENDMVVIESRAIVEKEEILSDETGEKFFISIKFPIIDSNNNVNGVCGMSTEITARKKAEHELLALKANLENVVAEKTKELTERISDLERFHNATINREIRMAELRDEIKKLKGKDLENGFL